MAENRFMTTIFCDDVRQEIGNKLSYLGVYASNLVVQTAPVNLLKLCLVMSVSGPASNPPRAITFRVYKGDELVLEQKLPESEIQKFETSRALPNNGNDHVFVIGAIAQLVNFPITEACRVKARAVVDDEELKGGSLDIMIGTQPVTH